MTGTWVDFKELRSKLRFADVLRHYGVSLKVKGDRATGFCPLPGHPKHDGKRHSPSFSANLARGIFQCFGCQARGNCLDFAAYMEGVDPSDSAALRTVALKLQDQFLSGLASPSPVKTGVRPKTGQPTPSIAAAPDKPRVINAPIDFELKKLDPAHPYLFNRGFTRATIDHFGLGHCARGLMADRIAIPLHDAAGKLIGYAGRLVDDDKISDEHPKYRFPGERERDGVIYDFRKSHFLYNGHCLAGPVQDLIVVEGFASVWWLLQCGYENTVALMGSSCSGEQAELIRSIVPDDGHVWILADGDHAGGQCAQSLFTQLAPFRLVRWVKLDDGLQPTDCTPYDLSYLLPFSFNRKEVSDVDSTG